VPPMERSNTAPRAHRDPQVEGHNRRHGALMHSNMSVGPLASCRQLRSLSLDLFNRGVRGAVVGLDTVLACCPLEELALTLYPGACGCGPGPCAGKTS